MAHFAKIEKNVVMEVIVINNDDINNLEFPESEKVGKEFISKLGIDGEYVQTSYNNNFRVRYAIIGGTYDKELDAFLEPKPFPSWKLNKELFWEPPVPYPLDDENQYRWDEISQNWEIAYPENN